YAGITRGGHNPPRLDDDTAQPVGGIVSASSGLASSQNGMGASFTGYIDYSVHALLQPTGSAISHVGR
ncbi:MAG TPA: hypothetical protein VK513_06610, partial [Terriglobales bacterium]|nr:hypothetical protein [Terriglobales bacterium]